MRRAVLSAVIAVSICVPAFGPQQKVSTAIAVVSEKWIDTSNGPPVHLTYRRVFTHV
jgi:hypothetical protein